MRRSALAAALMMAVTATIAMGQTNPPTAVTYQGELRQSGSLYSGSADFRIALLNGPAGSVIHGPITRLNVAVAEGRFTLSGLEFGTNFESADKWYQVEVRVPHDPTDTAAYVTMTPAVPVAAAPRAVFAERTNWSNILSMPSGFADGIDNGFTVAGIGLIGGGNNVALDLSYTDGRYFQIQNNSLAGDVFGFVSNVTVAKLNTKPLAPSSLNPQHNDVLTWDVNQGGWAPKATQHWLPGQGMQQITGSYAVDFTVLDSRYMGQNPILGGDLNGVANAATVAGLQGRPVVNSAPTPNQVLKWSGSAWGPAADTNTTYTAGFGLSLASNQFAVNVSALSPSFIDENQSFGGDVSGLFGSLTVNRIKGRDVTNLAPNTGDVLKWTGAIWNVVPDNDTQYTAGSGLTLAGTVFSIPSNGVTAAMLATDSAGLNKVSGGNVFIQSNNLAVGAGTPTSKLHVFGDLALTGTIIMSAPPTRYWSAPSTTWEVPSGQPTTVTFTSGGWQGQNNSTVYMFEMDVHLPHGATITSLDAWALDNNGNDMTFQVVRVPHDGSASTTPVSGTSSGAVAGTVRQFSVAGSHVVDNTTAAYRLRASWNTGSQPANLRLHGVRASFTVTTPLP